MKTMLHRLLPCLGLLLLVTLASKVSAQVSSELTGTLKKVRASGTVVLGHRESSLPFSYVTGKGEAQGYSIELCRALVDAMSEALGKELRIKWQSVTSSNRIDQLETGQIDLECGSTTNNAQRRERVAFSPIIFVAGTKLLVRQGSTIKSYRDLSGKAVAVTAGTTNERTVQELAAKQQLKVKLTSAPDHEQAYSLLSSGAVEAFATDDVLLYGLINHHKSQQQFSVVGDYMSYDPYGIMYRKGDTAMKELVESTFYKLAQDGELQHIYDKWFLTRLPGGERMNLPMSAQLDSIFRSMSNRPE